ncbi:MAG: alpha/beta fold hydrolase [Phycisphaerae bacterium]
MLSGFRRRRVVEQTSHQAMKTVRQRTILTLTVILGALTLTAGCAAHPELRIEQLSRGYVVMLPGVESSAWQFAGVVKGLREAGVDQAIDVVEWGDRSSGSISNLTDFRRNQERAVAIAFRITGYQRCYPAAPITLIGYSGGGGLAVLVAEALPDDVQLDRIILIGAAISPDHDLTKAIAHCRRGLVNFYSERDWFMLGWGTSTFGTIDRKKTESAGRRGFLTPEGALREEPGLIQIAWNDRWSALGHNGGHIGWLARPWAQEVLARHVVAAPDQWAGGQPTAQAARPEP